MAQKQGKGTAGQKPEKSLSPAEVTVTRSTKPVPARTPRHLWPVSVWEREMDRFFEDFQHFFRWPRLWSRERWPSVETELGLPTADIYEDNDEIVVKADIPGASKDDIEVNLTDTTLTIKGEKKKEEEVRQEDYYRCERSFGSFSRTVELPAAVRTEQAKATFKDGVLEVRLPKTEEAKRKAIKVEVK